jgi:hypothetical protein
MDPLTFIVGVLNASIWWPAALVLIVLLLRKPITERLGELRRVKWRGLEAEFDKGLKQVEVKVEELPETKKIAASDTSKIGIEYYKGAAKEGMLIIVDEDNFSRLAELSPPAAIVHAWLEVEVALKSLAERHDIRLSERASPLELIKQLAQRELLDRETISILDSLRGLRNTAAHARALDLNPNQAKEYKSVVRRLVAALSTR